MDLLAVGMGVDHPGGPIYWVRDGVGEFVGAGKEMGERKVMLTPGSAARNPVMRGCYFVERRIVHWGPKEACGVSFWNPINGFASAEIPNN